MIFEGGGDSRCCAPVGVSEEEEGDFSLEGPWGEERVKVSVGAKTGVEEGKARVCERVKEAARGVMYPENGGD